MKNKVVAVLVLIFLLITPYAVALTPVEDSAEDLFWEDPMTAHDYKKSYDLHNVAVSAMALTELEFVRLGDGLISLTTRNKKSPISNSLDSLEYAYSKLPRVEPVRRFGQFWDALQLRQISLSDARLAGMILFGDSVGGVTPIIQVRVYKLVVFVEDVINDIDEAVMFPVNWSASSLRGKPTRVKSLGYVADGLGIFRWNFSLGLKIFTREVVQAGSKAVTVVEKPYDLMIRHKRKKKNAQVLIYSKMPLSVFLENQSYFLGKKKKAFVGTLGDWHARIYQNPELLPEDIREEDFRIEALPVQEPSREVIVAAEYGTWDKTPQELKKYVITADELRDLMQQYSAPSPSAQPA